MQISQKSKNTIDACRFCWMCRHICPIGNATGQERNTARARALSLSMVERGSAQLTDDIIDNVYQCALCGACTNDCATGFDPVEFTKETRLEAAQSGKMPSYVHNMLDNIKKSGNIYGKEEGSKALTEAIASLPKKSDTLLFIGKDTLCFAPENAVNAITLLKKGGVDFTVLADEPDSGYTFDFLFGKSEETKNIMTNAANKLNEFKTVIAYDPADAKVLMREYKEWGIGLTTEVKTFTAFTAQLIADGKIKPKKTDACYTYQDSALLSRDIDELQCGRDILSACGENLEMLLNKKDTVLAGNLIMNEYIPSVMTLVAQKRWKDALHVGAKTLVTACAAEYVMLKNTKPEESKLLTIEEVALKCL